MYMKYILVSYCYSCFQNWLMIMLESLLYFSVQRRHHLHWWVCQFCLQIWCLSPMSVLFWDHHYSLTLHPHSWCHPLLHTFCHLQTISIPSIIPLLLQWNPAYGLVQLLPIFLLQHLTVSILCIITLNRHIVALLFYNVNCIFVCRMIIIIIFRSNIQWIKR